jgi:hypothetical protein
MATFSDFLPSIRAEISTAPKQTMLMAVKNAVRTLCDRSQIWAVTLDPVPLFSGSTEVDIDDLPKGAEVSSVISCTLDGTTLAPGTAFTTSADCLHIDLAVPCSDKAVSVVRVALRPTFAAESIPDWLLNDYLETVTHGALATLQAQSSREWFNPAGHTFHHANFYTGIGRAKIWAVRGGRQNCSMHVRPRHFI